VVALGGVLAKRDLDQQRRIDLLSERVAAIDRASPPPASAPATGDAVCRLDRSTFDALVRAAARVAVPVPATVSSAPPPSNAREQERSAEEDAALTRAHERVADVLRRTRLSRADVLDLRRELQAAGSAKGAEEIRRDIIVAINKGQLTPEDPHLILP